MGDRIPIPLYPEDIYLLTLEELLFSKKGLNNFLEIRKKELESAYEEINQRDFYYLEYLIQCEANNEDVGKESMIFISGKGLLKGKHSIDKTKFLHALRKEYEEEFESLKVIYDGISTLDWDICLTGYTDVIYVSRETNKRI
ncbi:hypothetical protein COU53_02245 [Candidatus Pacearchaeota archaeon CG10_big_fil_rev_8_21_14_0_10_30_48]|nr:MAG: hypothetical protein COU53_02245 [Candidatus Pacearchaeota archaeon CG10_big_fil_rev_8_21_14_0_10_30_48]